MAKPHPNLLDRAIATFAPGWALNRMRARGMMALSGGYFGGGKGRRPALSGWNPGAADADGDISPDLTDLRAYSRDLARTSALAGGAINVVVSNVVGTGLSMQPTPDATFLKLDEATESAWVDGVDREWKLWAESFECDVTRAQNFYGLQSMVFRSVLESGDCFIIPTMEGRNPAYKLALQVIEADRVCNPNFSADTERLVQGVELDEYGAPAAYHVCNKHPGSRQRSGLKWTRIPAFQPDGRRNVLHIFDRRRPGQTRGVPYLAGVIEPLKQLKRYSDAEISAAVISAAFAVFVKMDPEAFMTLFDDDGTRQTYLGSALKWDGGVPTASMDAPGKAVNLLPGESIEAPDLGRPNAQFDPFFLAVCKQIGSMLELPMEVLLKHFNASYSASRAALLDAWRFFRGRRDFLATAFCGPVHGLWFEEAVAIGRVRAPGYFADPAWRRAWSTAVWTGDGPGSIDPVKDVVAAKERIAQGISTIAAESLAYDGVGWESKNRQRIREVNARREGGLDVEPIQKVGAGQTAEDREDDDQPAGQPQQRSFGGTMDAVMAHAIDDYDAADRALLVQTYARVGLVDDRLTGIETRIDNLASREPVQPVVNIQQGDIHVAQPDIRLEAIMPEQPAPTVDVHLEAVMPTPVVENKVDVHVPEASAPAAVQKMEIVAMPGMRIESMPTRETTTDIQRDGKGNITKSTQTEKDA